MRYLSEELEMLVARILSRLLWSVGYPCIAPLSGKYPVGAIQTRLPDSVACQIHYPADASSTNKAFVPYFRPRAMEGMADYSKTSPHLLRFLSLKRHPCLMNVDPVANEKFPLVLFSHGLGGCMEMYTQLCQQISSHGFVVVALEHEDGSGAYAESALGQPILYKRPDDTPYSRQKVLNFRRPFLNQRVQETTDVLDILLNKPDTTKLPRQLLEAMDPSQGVSFVGHSFGGATLILAAQKYLSEQAAGQPKFVPKSISLLDVWAFSMQDQAIQQGLPIPTLSLISEGWLTNPEVAQLDQFLQNCKSVSSFLIPNSVHASFSDAAGWLPRMIGSKLYLRGKKERTYDTIPTAAEACVRHIQLALNSDDAEPITPTSDLLKVYDYNGSLKETETATSSAS